MLHLMRSASWSSTQGRLAVFAAVALPYLGLVLVHIMMGWPMAQPHLFADELGYLGHARYIAGTGRMPDMGTTTYYHFGYSLFLIPAFRLFPDPEHTYRAVVVTNAFLISLLYFAIYFLLRTGFDTRRFAASCIALVTCLYPAFLLQSNLAWSENAFIPAYGGAVAALYGYLKRQSYVTALVFALLAGFLYTIHPRGIVVIAVSALLLIVLALRGSVRRGPAATALICLITILLGTDMVNDHLRSIGWMARRGPVSLSGFLQRAMSAEGALGFVLAISGQLLYLSQATAGLFLVGLWYACVSVWTGFRDSEQRARRWQSWAVLFAVLSSLALVFASGVAMARGGTRADHLVYGRYNEPILGIYLALALVSFQSGWFRERWRSLGAAVVVTFGLLTALVVGTRGDLLLSRAIVPANVLGIYPVVAELGRFDLVVVSLTSTALFIVVAFLSMKALIAGLSLLVLCFSMVAESGYSSFFLRTQRHIRNANTLPGVMRELGDDIRLVGYDMSFNRWRTAPLRFFSYQYLLPHTRLARFSSRQKQIPPSTVVISGTSWPQAERYRARLVAVESGTGQALWLLPGSIQERLFPKTYRGVVLGAAAVRGIAESGFHEQERNAGGPFRWTDGAARLLVPLGARPPTTLTIQLAGGPRPPVRVVVNGRVLFEGRFPRSGRQTFDLSEVPMNDRLRLELLSDTFVPAAVRTGSRDRRTLGVAVRAIRVN